MRKVEIMKKILVMTLCMATVSIYGFTFKELNERVREGKLTGAEANELARQEVERIRHGVTSEEAKQIVRDSMDDLMNPPIIRDPVWGWGLYNYLRPDALYDDALPEFYKILGENIDERSFALAVVDAFFMIDGLNLTSEGEREALEWTMKIVERHGMSTELSKEYLARKGDADVLNALKQRGHTLPELEIRVQGTNIFKFMEGLNSWHPPNPMVYKNPRFIPSVANTGPQAVYVYEILKCCWEQAGQDFSKIPGELLTMAVWFDDDGNPVCDVDLAKHGLSMPVITPKPDKYNRGEGLSVTFPHEQEGLTPPVTTLTPPPVAETDGESAATLAPSQGAETNGKPAPPTPVIAGEAKPDTRNHSRRDYFSSLWMYIIAAVFATAAGAGVWKTARKR